MKDKVIIVHFNNKPIERLSKNNNISKLVQTWCQSKYIFNCMRFFVLASLLIEYLFICFANCTDLINFRYLLNNAPSSFLEIKGFYLYTYIYKAIISI